MLRCTVTYGGSARTIDTLAGNDPYTAEAVDIDGRFLFKAVVRGDRNRITLVRLYVYQPTARQPRLLHDARYLPPFAEASGPFGLTGDQTVYAMPLERQLHYGCALVRGAA